MVKILTKVVRSPRLAAEVADVVKPPKLVKVADAVAAPPSLAKLLEEATGSSAMSAIQSAPKNEEVALAAITTLEEAFKFAHPTLRKQDAFAKKAAIANPILLMPELQDEYAAKAIDAVLPAARREKLMADPDVAKAVNALKAKFAQVPDLNPAIVYDRRLLATLLENRVDLKGKDPRPIAVIVYPKDDYNGQFFGSSTGELAPMTKKYRVMFYQVGSDTEFVNAIKSGTERKPAELVYVGGHGEPTLAAFGADDPARLPPDLRAKLSSFNDADRTEAFEALTKIDEDKFLDFSDTDILAPLKGRFAKGADLVLMSCSTGKGGAGGDKAKPNNLANYLHGLFPQVRVHAPIEPVQNLGVILDAKGKFARAGFADIGKAYVVEPEK